MSKKEIFFLFSVNQKLFTDTAIELSQKKNSISFSGLAYSKHQYFSKFTYKKIFYINDIIYNFSNKEFCEYNQEIDISYYENQFNINFSELIHLDRHLIRKKKDSQIQIAINLIKFIINYLKKNKPSIIIAEGVDDLVSYIACKYCEKNNLKFFSIQNARLGNGLIFSDRVDSGSQNIINDYNSYYEKITNNNNFSISKYDKFITSYISQKKKVYYLNKIFDFKDISLRDLNKFYAYFKEYFFDKKGFHYKDHPLILPVNRLLRQIKNYYYIFFIQKIKLKDLNKLNFFYYGLHVYPEAATLIIGRETPDQLNLIKLISKALPYGKSLVVKEHPHSIGKRDIFFYNEINKMNNVFLINHDENNFDILNLSEGLVTISSSLSLEAALLKKPVYIFGDYYLSIDKNCKKIKSFSDLKELLKNKKNNYDLNSRKALIYAIQKNSIYLKGYLNSRNYKSETIIDFAREIIDRYKL